MENKSKLSREGSHEPLNSSSAANEFVKGAAWGFVAFVHVALVMVVTYKFTLNCLPASIVEWLACQPADSAKCAMACDPSKDTLFYALAGFTAMDAITLPVFFGFFQVARWRRKAARP